MNECSNITSIGAYHDGELSEARRAEVEQHLSDCAACSAELEELRRLSAWVESDEAEAISPRFIAELHDDVEDLTDSSVLRFAQLVCGIAAAVLIGVGGWLMATPEAPVQGEVVWEQAALTLRPETPAASGPIRTAEWMAAELAKR